MDRLAAAFGAQLRHWRRHRAMTQEALAGDAGVSTRHLSWLETGRALPSRAMLLRLADRLEVPLRERHVWLRAAGYAPMYRERPLHDPALATVRSAAQSLLDAHAPWPALAVDRHWNLVAANTAVPRLLGALLPGLQPGPVNVLRLTLSPQGLAPMVEGLAAWRAHLLARLQRQIDATGDAVLLALLAELAAMPVPDEAGGTAIDGDEVVVPLVLRTPLGRLCFVSTVTVFGAPHDITTAELAIETLFPADGGTAEVLRRLRCDVPIGCSSVPDLGSWGCRSLQQPSQENG